MSKEQKKYSFCGICTTDNLMDKWVERIEEWVKRDDGKHLVENEFGKQEWRVDCPEVRKPNGDFVKRRGIMITPPPKNNGIIMGCGFNILAFLRIISINQAKNAIKAMYETNNSSFFNHLPINYWDGKYGDIIIRSSESRANEYGTRGLTWMGMLAVPHHISPDAPYPNPESKGGIFRNEESVTEKEAVPKEIGFMVPENYEEVGIPEVPDDTPEEELLNYGIMGAMKLIAKAGDKLLNNNGRNFFWVPMRMPSKPGGWGGIKFDDSPLQHTVIVAYRPGVKAMIVYDPQFNKKWVWTGLSDPNQNEALKLMLTRHGTYGFCLKYDVKDGIIETCYNPNEYLERGRLGFIKGFIDGRHVVNGNTVVGYGRKKGKHSKKNKHGKKGKHSKKNKHGKKGKHSKKNKHSKKGKRSNKN